MMMLFGVFLTAFGLIFKKPLLYAFGASDATWPFADAYITIYMLGSIFVMVGLGMNSFINSQGFGRIGMCTVLLGAAAIWCWIRFLFSAWIWGFREPRWLL